MNRKWWTLVAVCIATFMLLLDITIVNVALPAIERDLHANFADLQWVIDAYALTLAALLLTAGSLADMLGPAPDLRDRDRRSSPSPRCCARWPATPHVLNLVARAAGHRRRRSCSRPRWRCSPPPSRGRDRGTAFGVWGATTGAAVAVGPLVGGVLTDGIGWEAIFFVNLPIGIAGDRARRSRRWRSRATRARARHRLAGPRDVLRRAVRARSSRSSAATPRAGAAR